MQYIRRLQEIIDDPEYNDIDFDYHDFSGQPSRVGNLEELVEWARHMPNSASYFISRILTEYLGPYYRLVFNFA